MNMESLINFFKSGSSRPFSTVTLTAALCAVLGAGLIAMQRNPAVGAPATSQSTQNTEKTSDGLAGPEASDPANSRLKQTADTGKSADMAVDFGEFGRQAFRRRLLKSIIDPLVVSDSFATDFRAWSSAARDGDGTAAYALYDAVAACRDSHADTATLEAAVNQLYSERTQTFSDGTQAHDLDGDLATTEAAMRRDFEYCGDFKLQGEQGEPNFWLKMSADDGFAIAQNAHGQNLARSGNFDEALHYFEMAWQSGSRVAPEHLYALYKKGGANFDPDPVLATAYAYIFSGVFESLYMNTPRGPIVTRYANRIAARTEQEIDLLRPNERELALITARELLAANDECCFDR